VTTTIIIIIIIIIQNVMSSHEIYKKLTFSLIRIIKITAVISCTDSYVEPQCSPHHSEGKIISMPYSSAICNVILGNNDKEEMECSVMHAMHTEKAAPISLALGLACCSTRKAFRRQLYCDYTQAIIIATVTGNISIWRMEFEAHLMFQYFNPQ
jgi:hypothetical protein